ncbi:MAG: FixH family protein [Alphaproteobacteria bacterium]|nr:FixH family protein [Alphaproteobacteria bacterium]
MAHKQRADGWWYPWIFVGGMVLVALVNGIMIFIALDTWTGLETEGHYRKGLNYNQNLAAADAQMQREWRFDLVWKALDGSQNTREIEMRAHFFDRHGKALNDLNVTALLVRPTHEGFDFEVPMQAQGNGAYLATASLPLAGQWNVRVHALRDGEVFQEVRRLQVR